MTNMPNKDKDALSALTSDHEKVRKLLAQLAETTERGVKTRQELLAKIETEIQVHAQLEEEIFYPAFRQATDKKKDEALFHEAQEEHHLVKLVLPELVATDVATPMFTAKAKVIKDLVEHHIREEESEIFPRVRELMGKDELVNLGEQLEARRHELMV
jgi:hemerythrin-like domain-containing protein